MSSEPDYDLITFGETMIRLATVGHQRLEDSSQLDLSIGGTESNVAVALSRLGRRAAWLSALPSNPLGRKINATLQQHGVITDHIIWSENSRAGLYFLDVGVSPRPTRVTYDRANSAIAELDPDQIDLSLVERARALHLTGITPTLSPTCATICLQLAERANTVNVPVILDVNYRALLWSPEEARLGLAPLLDLTTLLFCGVSDAQTIWGLTGTPQEIANELLTNSNANLIVLTLGDAGAYAVRRDGERLSQPGTPVEIVDPIGAGDAFAAGFLDHWIDRPDDVAGALRAGVALASLKMTIPGDLAIVTRDELIDTLTMLDQPGDEVIR